MPVLPAFRTGTLLEIKGRPVPYSFWPMRRGTRRFGLQSHLFTPNPWVIIASSVKKYSPTATRPAALAFLEQAEEYYQAATQSGMTTAKPVLLYYCFMNLAKAYISTFDPAANLSQPRHGLSEKVRAGKPDWVGAYLEAFRAGPEANLFDMFQYVISNQHLVARRIEFELPSLVPQIVTGHRLWCQATGRPERFVALQSIQFVHDRRSQTVWLRFTIPPGDLTRLGLTHQRLLEEAGLLTEWHEVKTPSAGLLCFEHTRPNHYTDRPSDVLNELALGLRKSLWTTVLSQPPYRRYYLYTVPAAEKPQVLPQLLSIYAVMFYLGSITRYRPQDFKKLLVGDVGSQVYTILSEQPTQFIYLMTSEFAKQEVTKAAIV